MSETVTFDIDFNFIGNAVTAQTQMLGLLKNNQFLEVVEVEFDEEDELFRLTCNIHEEDIN